MNTALLEILACPICKGELIYNAKAKELICHFDRRAYPIINEIPVLLISRARRLELDEN